MVVGMEHRAVKDITPLVWLELTATIRIGLVPAEIIKVLVNIPPDDHDRNEVVAAGYEHMDLEPPGLVQGTGQRSLTSGPPRGCPGRTSP